MTRCRRGKRNPKPIFPTPLGVVRPDEDMFDGWYHFRPDVAMPAKIGKLYLIRGGVSRQAPGMMAGQYKELN